jgi:hypothetical protein
MGTHELFCDFFVDDCLESLERLRSGKEPAVDEKRGRSGHTHRLTFPVILLDGRTVLSGIEALAEGARVECQICGDLPVGHGGQRPLVLEDPIVELPELALVMSAERGLSGGVRFGVVGKREITINEPDLVSVSLLDLL